MGAYSCPSCGATASTTAPSCHVCGRANPAISTYSPPEQSTEAATGESEEAGSAAAVQSPGSVIEGFGWVIAAISFVALGVSLLMDTTYDGVHNTGLLNQKLAYVITNGACMICGILFVVVGAIRKLSRTDE